MSTSNHFDLVGKHFWRKREYGVVASDGVEKWHARLHHKSIDLQTANGMQAATAKKHSFRSDIDIHLAASNATAKLTRRGRAWSTTKSLYFRGQTVTWQKDGRIKDSWNFYDERGGLVATFTAKLWEVGKSGTYDVHIPAVDAEMMELIVLLGLIELEQILAIQAAASG